MNAKLDKEYIKIIKYVSLGFFILCVIYRIVINPQTIFEDVKRLFFGIIGLFTPLLYGLVIAYLCMPIVKIFEKAFDKIGFISKAGKTKKRARNTFLYLKRSIAVILTFISVLFVITLFAYSIYVMVGGSFKDFSFEKTKNNLVITINKYFFELSGIDQHLQKIGISTGYVDQLKNLLGSFSNTLQIWLTTAFNIVSDIGKVLGNIVFGLIFAASFIVRREYFITLCKNLLLLLFSENKKDIIQNTLSEINKVFHNFFRSQLLDLTLISIVTSISLLIVGCDFAILVGLFAGYTNIIPYIGSWGGALPGLFIGIAEGGVGRGLFIYFYILIIQQIYYWTISPKIQGESLGLHPVFILLALTTFGSLFGILGMILAIPLAGIVKIFIKKWADKRKAKLGVNLIEYEED